MSSLNNILFKYFLKYDIWKEAKKLLDFQIDSTFKSYNNLNFFYFRKIKGTEKLETKGYFEQRIENNAFYGLVDEFFFHKYNTPKQGMGLRLYSFFSYPMLLLYYSIGIYLLKLTSQFILDNKKNFNLSRYGGNLKIDTSGNLIVNESSTLYRDHYFAFKKDIRLQILERDNKAVIKLDIQNYFDCISMSNLLDLIDKSVKPSEKTILNYDEHTIKTLKFYFNFLNSNTLPQGNNNLISGYIGFLYLFFGDLEIESILKDLN
ncbi:MAG: hypothetical protein MUF43_10950, partial [Flavobacterium sp.]|nr:hypothetical protein [Flavobacterium sp.]